MRRVPATGIDVTRRRPPNPPGAARAPATPAFAASSAAGCSSCCWRRRLRRAWRGSAACSAHQAALRRPLPADRRAGRRRGLTIDRRNGRAYISASDRRAARPARRCPAASGRTISTQPEARPVNLTPDATLYLQPHGISLWIEPDGQRGALRRQPSGAPGTAGRSTAIEIYDVAGRRRCPSRHAHRSAPGDAERSGRGRHRPLLRHQHPRASAGTLQTLETYLQLRGAQVLHYGPGGFTTAIARPGLPQRHQRQPRRPHRLRRRDHRRTRAASTTATRPPTR